jgi:Fe-S oxidoreductase
MDSKRDLDLVLIHPGSRTQIYQSLGSSLSAIEPPVWASLMATFVRRRGFSVAVLDAEGDDLSPEATATRVAEMNPLLAAVVVYGHQPSASTQNMTAAGAICAALKQMNPERKVLMVGGHVAALPERTLQEEAADFVCSGEGPYTVLELLEALKSGRADYSKVRGLCYTEDGAVRSSPAAPLVKDLDHEMPEMAWDLLPMQKYRAHNWHCFGDLERQPYASLYTTFGCPYHCSFCCIQAPFKSGEKVAGWKESVNSYRFWSPQAVIGQIDKLVGEYGVRNIKIADEMFVLNPRHVLGICDAIIDRGYDLNIWAYARVDTVKEEMLESSNARALIGLPSVSRPPVSACAIMSTRALDKKRFSEPLRKSGPPESTLSPIIFSGCRGQSGKHAGNAGSRLEFELRVCELLFCHGLSRFAPL